MKNIPIAVIIAASAVLSGCSTIEKQLRAMPAFSFESWVHSDRYGLFTDSVAITGASWVVNPDGSATLTVADYNGNAAWAGTMGPQDSLKNLSVTFPADSQQAKALKIPGKKPTP